jgi:long-chain fatty acid transport protein
MRRLRRLVFAGFAAVGLTSHAQAAGFHLQERSVRGVVSANTRDPTTTSSGVGLDYAVNPRLRLRAGARYDPSPTPDLWRSGRPPEGDRWLYGVGATADATSRLQVETTFGFTKVQRSRLDPTAPSYTGMPAATSNRGVGGIRGKGFVLSLGVRGKF